MSDTIKYLEDMIFPASYFEDEVREGFFVSSMMKRYWAAQLTVLSEVDRVCRKYGIRWYADNGTLLGAVRHKGYIPWDDDLDISMLRSDYERFMEIAGDELPPEYRILTIRHEAEFTEMLGRIVNTDKIDYSEGHLKKYHGCPYTVGIDIFPLDPLYNDEAAEEERRQRLIQISDAVRISANEGSNSPKLKIPLLEIERKNKIKIKRNANLHHSLLLLAEQLYMECTSADAEYVALMPYWVSHHNHKYPVSLFFETVYLPFENTYLPVPAIYDEVLRIEYGDYMRIHKDGGVHEYPVYKEQEEIYRRVRGEYPFRYTMNPGTELMTRDIVPLRGNCMEITDTLIQAHGQIEGSVSAQDDDTFVSLLEGCQNLAIALGTLVEERMPAEVAIVHALEDYCEDIFSAGTQWNSDFHIKLDEEIRDIERQLDAALRRKRKEILILPCKEQWWSSLGALCDELCSRPDTDVYVMPVPYVVRDMFGAPDDIEFYKRSFPTNVVFTSDYDFITRHPDMIVTQYPYDEWNTIIQIPEKYYSRNLLAYTDELVYVPWAQTDDPSGDSKAAAALKYLIEQPALIYADKILLQSESIRKLYIDALDDMTGHREYWERKTDILTGAGTAGDMKTPASDTEYVALHERSRIRERRKIPDEWSAHGERKRLLFEVSVSFVLEYREAAIKKINDALDTILEASAALICVFSPHESMGQLAGIDERLGAMYEDILRRVCEDDRIIYDRDHQAGRYLYSMAGYYGNESDLALRCVDSGVPVMLMRITKEAES